MKKALEKTFINQEYLLHYKYRFLKLILLIGLIVGIIYHPYIRSIIIVSKEKKNMISQQLLNNMDLSQPYGELSTMTDIEEEKSLISQKELAKLLKSIYEEVLFTLESKKAYLDPNLSLIKFSSMIGTNTTYLSKAINKYFNCNFKTLINKYRVEYSKILLTDNNCTSSIKEIALRCGFISLSAYYASFKKVTHLSPLQYKIITLYMTHSETEQRINL